MAVIFLPTAKVILSLRDSDIATYVAVIFACGELRITITLRFFDFAQNDSFKLYVCYSLFLTIYCDFG